MASGKSVTDFDLGQNYSRDFLNFVLWRGSDLESASIARGADHVISRTQRFSALL